MSIQRWPPALIQAFGDTEKVRVLWEQKIDLELMHEPETVMRNAYRVLELKSQGKRLTPRQVFLEITNL